MLIRRMASENILWVSGGSKRSWRGWGSRSRPEPLSSTCACRTTENHRPAGEPFLNGTLLRSGPVISSASRHCGSRPCMPSSWSATPVVECAEHVEVTRHPTAEWVAQQIVECCGWERSPPPSDPRSAIAAMARLDLRLKNLGITQVRTPFRVPQANSIAERWVRSTRQECLDHTFIFAEGHLRRVLA